jgi:hypothetical protein
MLICAVVLHLTHPSLSVLNQPFNAYNIFVNIVNTYVVLLALGTIQFWLGLKLKILLFL